MLILLEMKKPEQIHDVETAVTEFDQLQFPFKYPYKQNDHLRLSLASLHAIYELGIPSAFQRELEIQYFFSYILKGFTQKCNISKTSLVSVYNSAFKVTTRPRSKIRWLSNTHCAFLWAIVLALCIHVFSSCLFLFSFRIHPFERNILSLYMHSDYTLSLTVQPPFYVLYLKHSDLFCECAG